MLGRRWSNVVEDSLIDSKVHEIDAEFTLNFSFFFNAVFDDHAHLLNCIHFSLLCHEDPIFKHLIKVERVLAHTFELVKGPVTHLTKPVAEDRLLNLNSFTHFLHIDALLHDFLLLSCRSALLGVLFSTSFLRVGSSLYLCDIDDDLLLDGHG